jgi:multidrug efflux pump subunit AcrA (membrane-fusion protein)
MSILDRAKKALDTEGVGDGAWHHVRALVAEVEHLERALAEEKAYSARTMDQRDRAQIARVSLERELAEERDARLAGKKASQEALDKLERELAEARAQLSQQVVHPSVVTDQPGCPVAAPCAIEGCRNWALTAQLAAARAEIERLTKLALTGRCVYCGDIMFDGVTDQAEVDRLLQQHIDGCAKHPLAAARAEVERAFRAGHRHWPDHGQHEDAAWSRYLKERREP